jgi:hypothetical protein
MKLNPGFLIVFAVGVLSGLGVAFAIAGCASGTPTAKTVATDAVNGAETAWLLAATACQASPTPEIKTKCASVLLPARTALLAAALDVDQGGANYGCELAQVSAALSFVTSLGVTLPQGVKDAQALLVAVPCTVSATLEAGGTGTGPVPSSLLPPANLTGALQKDAQ